MATYNNVGKGQFFVEKDWQEGSKRPLYKGSSEIDGTQFDIALWARVSQKGQNYLSIVFYPKGGKDIVGTGALFEKTGAGRKAPCLTGKAEVFGVALELAVWRQTSEAGNEYFRLKVDVKEEA